MTAMRTWKSSPHDTMELGDPWTVICEEPWLGDDGSPVQIGAIFTKWFATNEPGRAFRVTAVQEPATYESVFIGFLIIDREKNETRIVPDWRAEEQAA